MSELDIDGIFRGKQKDERIGKREGKERVSGMKSKWETETGKQTKKKDRMKINYKRKRKRKKYKIEKKKNKKNNWYEMEMKN